MHARTDSPVQTHITWRNRLISTPSPSSCLLIAWPSQRESYHSIVQHSGHAHILQPYEQLQPAAVLQQRRDSYAYGTVCRCDSATCECKDLCRRNPTITAAQQSLQQPVLHPFVKAIMHPIYMPHAAHSTVSTSPAAPQRHMPTSRAYSEAAAQHCLYELPNQPRC